MAYLKTEEVAVIRKMLKSEFPSWKFSVVRNDNYSGVRIAIMESPVDFVMAYVGNAEQWYKDDLARGYAQINERWIDENWSGEALASLKKINEIAHSRGWYDRSDAMTDYFDVAYYVWLSLGKFDKPYKKIEAKTTAVVPAPSGDLDFEAIFAGGIVSEFAHTQSGDILQVLKLEKRLTKEQFISFNEWLKTSKRGYYSKYAGGFILTTDKNQKVA